MSIACNVPLLMLAWGPILGIDNRTHPRPSNQDIVLVSSENMVNLFLVNANSGLVVSSSMIFSMGRMMRNILKTACLRVSGLP